jgi:two-component system, cell cycle sensor histidine kinase and response regulator CckA
MTSETAELAFLRKRVSELETQVADLQASNEYLRKLYEQAPLGYQSLDVNGDFLEVNQAWLHAFGYCREEVVGRNFSEFLHPDWREHFRENFPRFKAVGEILGVEFEMMRKDGSFLLVSFHGKIGRDSSGCFQQTHCIFQDITSRKQTEEELRRRENQLQRIFEILPIGLWFADKHGVVLRGNPKGIEIWGAEPTVPISEYGVFKAWHLPSRKPVGLDEWALAKTIRNGETIVDELLEIESFDGKRKTILNYTAPVLDGDGQVDGAIIVNLDISERKVLEDQLLQAQKMESIGRLAGGVAHDFNNMLGVILGYSEMLLEQVGAGQPMYSALHGIQQAAQRSANLTRQLLAFARKQTVAPRVLDLNETVAGMLTMLRRLIGEDIDLAWLPGSDLGSIMMDPTQVDQILANLCVNARDAIGGNTGKVTIETANALFDQAYCAVHAGYIPGNYVLLALSDDGCGMDTETYSHLFEPFFTTKEVGKGTGLGLAMVYGIIRQNNGFINVYSEPGQGTTFKLYLPRYMAKGEAGSETAVAIQSLSGQETILLVEDEPMILEMVSAMLQQQSYTVLAAATPGEAIHLAREYAAEIHLLMTDVVMPEMNGRELAGNLLTLYPALKRLFMSGYTANVIAHHGVLDAGVHFIQKPFSIHELAVKVRKALTAEVEE